MARFGRAGLVCLRAALTLYAAMAVAVVLHEAGHGLSAVWGGGELRGYDVSLLPTGGRAYSAYPYMEASVFLRTFVSFGGPLADLLVGATTVWVSGAVARFRRSAFCTMIAAATLGKIMLSLLGLGVSGKPAYFADGVAVGTDLGFSMSAVRWASGLVGAIGAVLFGVWYCRQTLRWVGSTLPGATYADRVSSLLVAGWGPLACAAAAEILASLRVTEGPNAMHGQWLAMLVVNGAVLLGIAIVARFLRPESPDPVALSSPVWAPALRAALLAGAACSCVIWFGWMWPPDRKVSAEVVAKWVERSPDDPKVLRRAAYWSHVSGRDDEARAYRERAARIAPNDPGAMYDLGASYRVEGRADDALALFREAERLRPDLEAIPAQIAKLEEDRGNYAEAAKAWRDYASRARRRSPRSESVDRHVRMMLDRSRRLDEMATDPTSRDQRMGPPFPSPADLGPDDAERSGDPHRFHDVR